MHGTTERRATRAPTPHGFMHLVAILALVATVAPSLEAQLYASEPASVSQVVDGTRVTVDYSRPRARGRTGLFGGEVKLGETWTPGANHSTTLAVSKDVLINGHPVPKGKYSVWMVVAPGDWELVLDHDTTLSHTQRPKPRPGQIRFIVPRQHHEFTETLTWAFPTIRTSGMTLTMQWDTVYVPLDIAVTPTFATGVPADAGQRVAGTYHWRWSPAVVTPPAHTDTTIMTGPPMKTVDATFTVRYVGGELRATLNPPGGGNPSGEYMLIQKSGDLYRLGRVERGELIEICDGCALQFTVANGHPGSFELRDTDDDLLASGTTQP
jgi:Protein of unknown function (DUF2911)